MTILMILPACSDDDPAAPTNVGDPPVFDTDDPDAYELRAAMWNPAGEGTWTEYDEQGSMVDSGSWGGSTG